VTSEAPQVRVVVAQNHIGACVLATDGLARGTLVDRFEGPEMLYEEVPESEIRYVLSFEPFRWMIPRPPARYLNHSCDPNCVVLSTREIVACRDVAAGEELTIAYDAASAEDVRRHPAHYFWDPRWTFTCRCGAAGCRSLIDRYRPA
jgi:hypothetical protein